MVDQTCLQRAFFGVLDLGIVQRHVVRQRLFFLTQDFRIFERRDHVVVLDVDAPRDPAGERFRVFDVRLGVGIFACDPRGIVPERQAVAAPIQRERPARQRFAGIPFSLPVMQ